MVQIAVLRRPCSWKRKKGKHFTRYRVSVHIMKTLLLTLTLAAVGISSVRAEIYRPSAVGPGAVLGAVAGALIGGHNNDRWAEGAIIGAAAGAVIGSVVDQSQPVVYSDREIRPVTVVGNAPCVTSYPSQVVYTSPAPRVVYVQRPVYVPAPVVYVGAGWRSGGYYGSGYRCAPPVYRHHHRR